MATGTRSTGAAMLLFCAAATSGFLSACRGGTQGGGRVVRDGLGRQVMVPARPRRIVSLAPSVTASLLALQAQDRIVGVTDYCVLPPTLGAISRIGGMLNPNLEAIRALEPDLLIGTTSGNDPSLARQTTALGLPLYTVHTPDVEGVLRSIADLGALLGDEVGGRVVVDGLRSRLETVRAAIAPLPPLKVLFVVWGDPLVVPGRASFLTDALARAGADSITADAPAAYPSFDVETAIDRAPEAILTSPQNRALLDRLKRDPAWANVPAIRSGRLAVVSEAIEQPGPEVLSGIEEVARALHPEAFGSASPGHPSTSPGGVD